MVISVLCVRKMLFDRFHNFKPGTGQWLRIESSGVGGENIVNLWFSTFLHYISLWQRWKKMMTLVTLFVLIFSSCTKFLDFHTILLHNFIGFLSIFAKFCPFWLNFAFFFLCLFLHAFFVVIFQTQKLYLCYFSRFFQLWPLVLTQSCAVLLKHKKIRLKISRFYPYLTALSNFDYLIL